jgi:hypothetical protein
MVTDPLARRRCFGRSITIRDRTLVLSCVFELLAKITLSGIREDTPIFYGSEAVQDLRHGHPVALAIVISRLP